MGVKSWTEFYSHNITLKEFLGNFYSHEFFNEMAKRKPKKILEVGSGSGVMGILLSHLGYKVVSIDSDKGVIDIAKKNNKKFNGSTDFKVGDGFNLEFKDNSFDISFSQGLYEHFSNKEIKKITDEQLRVCKNTIFVSVPNKNYGTKDVGNERLMNSRSWYKLLKKLYPEKKIKVVEYQYFLRKNKPIKTIFNLLLNKKVQTLIMIKK